MRLLEHPEEHPILPRPEGARILRVWRYPAFEAYTTWAVFEHHGQFRLRRLRWDRAADQLLKLEPTTYCSEVALPEALARNSINTLRTLEFPPFLGRSGIGLDGVTCGVETRSNFASSTLSWWCDAPAEWAALQAWFDRTVLEFEQLLPG